MVVPAEPAFSPDSAARSPKSAAKSFCKKITNPPEVRLRAGLWFKTLHSIDSKARCRRRSVVGLIDGLGLFLLDGSVGFLNGLLRFFFHGAIGLHIDLALLGNGLVTAGQSRAADNHRGGNNQSTQVSHKL